MLGAVVALSLGASPASAMGAPAPTLSVTVPYVSVAFVQSGVVKIVRVIDQYTSDETSFIGKTAPRLFIGTGTSANSITLTDARLSAITTQNSSGLSEETLTWQFHASGHGHMTLGKHLRSEQGLPYP
jgi:hypothetical protein